jgi:hypothetical protein
MEKASCKHLPLTEWNRYKAKKTTNFDPQEDEILQPFLPPIFSFI